MALIDGPNARVVAAHLGVNAYALQRQLYNLRMGHLSRVQRDVATDIAAAREPTAALVSQEQAALTSRVNDDLVRDLDTLLNNRQELMDYASQLRALLGWENDSVPSFPKMSPIRFGLRDGKPNLMDMYAEHSV